MSDHRSPEALALLGALRAIQAAQGMEFCDRCGGALFDEAVRCDPCCGDFGEPPQDEIERWLREHPGYFRQFGSEGDDFQDNYEDTN